MNANPTDRPADAVGSGGTIIDDLTGALLAQRDDLVWEDVADAAWLAAFLPAPTSQDIRPEASDVSENTVDQPDEANPENEKEEGEAGLETTPGETRPDEAASAPVHAPSPAAQGGEATGDGGGRGAPGSRGIPIRIPEAPALPDALKIGLALRPLAVREPSPTDWVLDEEATVRAVADVGLWAPVLRPGTSRTFELALVIDASPSMAAWHDALREFRRVLERLGAFRDVRGWRLLAGPKRDDPLILVPDGGRPSGHKPEELRDPSGRRIILVASDCTAEPWRDGRARDLLETWGRTQPIAIVQLLPTSLWRQTGLGRSPAVEVHARRIGSSNARLARDPTKPGRAEVPTPIPIPVLWLEPGPLVDWARMLTSPGGVGAPALLLKPTALPESARAAAGYDLPADDRVRRFARNASRIAQDLAACLAVAPLRMPVIRLVQRTMPGGASDLHLAEVLLGGLTKVESPEGADPRDLTLEYHDGVRQKLLDRLSFPRAVAVITAVSLYLQEHFGSSLDFPAILADPEGFLALPPAELDRPFARITALLLRRLGDRYTKVADRLEGKAIPGPVQPLHQEPAKNRYSIVQSRIEVARHAGSDTLDLSRLGLTSVPESLGQLAGLRELDMSGNQLASLPESLGRLARLQRLDLSGNQLTSLPESVGQLPLRELDLSGNQLTAVPESLGQLIGLEVISLSNNRLTAVPESLGHITGLQKLDLHGNRLNTVSESLIQLTSLRMLSLSSNRLAAVPESLGRLARLQELDLHGNRLTAVPESLGQLAALRVLSLSSNRLTAIPESLGQLAGLQQFDLHGNRLTMVPESLGQLAGLQQLSLHGNYALGIPPEILGPTWDEVVNKEAQPAKPADILQYYYRRRRERTRRLNEAKILLMGQGGVGKTSLVQRLVHDTFDPHKASTAGIEITQWMIPGKRGDDREAEQIRLHIWNFGGQEIMHATHQFFLTERSLYLVVLDARMGENEGNIQYWLKIVQSYGGDSPVLVVTNKTEEHPLELNEARLRRDYAPNLRGFVQVSVATGAGIAELRAAIAEQVNALPHVFDEIPASYFAVKEELTAAARTRNFLDSNEYRRICRANGLEQPRDQEILLRFLHDLGSVLNFHDPESPYDLRDTNILNPEWVTGGIYKILNNVELMRREGVLEMAQLGTILDNPKIYPPKRHKFFIELMRKFEFCFEFPDSNGQRFLIPELLRPDEPDLDWNTSQSLNFEYHYDLLPVWIIPRFIVRMHHDLTSKPTYWRSGVVLEIQGNRALVRGDIVVHRVFISVLGPAWGRRRALSMIRDALRAIHATIPKIVVLEKVPLPETPDVVVDYQHLLNLEEHGVDRFFPEGADRDYGVRELLEGVEPGSGRRHVEGKVNVLFLAANPADTNQLRLDEEVRAIKEQIRASKYPDALELITKWAVRSDDLLQYLNQYQPHVVHFSGPVGLTDEIVLIDRNDNPKPVSPSALMSLFRTLKDNIRVIVLNVYSQSQVQAITEHIDCAIGMNPAIGYEAAITFSASFYRAIGFGRSVGQAYEEARTALLLEGVPENKLPELLVRQGVNPSKIILLQ